MNKKIWLSSPHMGGSELNYINTAFESNWIAPLGPNVDGFEKSIADYTGVAHVAALSSGTAAIHLALIMLGVKPSDEVICQSMTFSGSANPIAYVGANPIFIDSEQLTWNMDPDLLREALVSRIHKGSKPKAIIYVHLYGMPALINDIVSIAQEFEIPLIEDAAEALGSTYFGKSVGNFGDISILSFNGNKIITTSGGGALLSSSKDFVEKAKFLSTQARDAAPHYQHSEIGYNYRISNICAGIGRGQMEVISERVNQRRAIFEYYKQELSQFEGVNFPQDIDGHHSNRWLTTITIDPLKTGGITRETIRLALEEVNIESRPFWKPMHLQPVFKNEISFANGVSESLFNDGLCLPSGTNMTHDDLERVISKIKSSFKKG